MIPSSIVHIEVELMVSTFLLAFLLCWSPFFKTFYQQQGNGEILVDLDFNIS